MGWKECTLLCAYGAYDFRLTLRAPRSEKSAESQSEGGFEAPRRSLLTLGLAVLCNRRQLVGACPHETCLRARGELSRAGVVPRMDMEMDRKA
jgi:hypothetical protein